MGKKATHRKGDSSLMVYEKALSLALGGVTWKMGVETVSLNKALGRTLRENVKSAFDIPPFDKSAMDGYAVRSADTKGACEDSPATLDVIEDLPASDALSILKNGPGAFKGRKLGILVTPGW